MELIRRHVQRHMRRDIQKMFQRSPGESAALEEDKVWLDDSVNVAVWARGMQKPPRRIRVIVTKEDGFPIEVKLAEE